MNTVKYKQMKAAQLRAKLAEHGLLETGLKTKDQYIKRLLEDDQGILDKAAPSKATHIVKGLFTVPRLYCSHAD